MILSVNVIGLSIAHLRTLIDFGKMLKIQTIAGAKESDAVDSMRDVRT